MQKCAGDIPALTNVIYVEDVPLKEGLTLPNNITMTSFDEVYNFFSHENEGSKMPFYDGS